LPTNNVLAKAAAGLNAYFAPVVQATPLVQMNGTALGSAGGGQPHNNLMPYLTLNFCIALQGVYPSRP
jgi:microcystin-dependent protein